MPLGGTTSALPVQSDVEGARGVPHLSAATQGQVAAVVVGRTAGVFHRVSNVLRNDVQEVHAAAHPERAGILGEEAVAQALHGALTSRRLRRRLLASLQPPSSAHGPTAFAPVIMPPFPDSAMPGSSQPAPSRSGGAVSGGAARARLASSASSAEAAAAPSASTVVADAPLTRLALSVPHQVLLKVPANGVSLCALQAGCSAAHGVSSASVADTVHQLVAFGALQLQSGSASNGTCGCGLAASRRPCAAAAVLVTPLEPVAAYARGLLQRAAVAAAPGSPGAVPALQVGLLSDPARHAAAGSKLQASTWFQSGFLPVPPPLHRQVSSSSAPQGVSALATSSTGSSAMLMEDEVASPLAGSVDSESVGGGSRGAVSLPSGYPLVPGQHSFFPASDADASRALLGFIRPSPPLPTVADAFNAGGGGPERLLGDVEGRGANAAYASFMEWLPRNLRLKGYALGGNTAASASTSVPAPAAAAPASSGSSSSSSCGERELSPVEATPTPTGWLETSVTPLGFITDTICRALAHVQVAAGPAGKRSRAAPAAASALEGPSSPHGGGALCPAAAAAYASSCSALSGVPSAPPKPLSRLEGGDAALAQEILDDRPLGGALVFTRSEDSVVAVKWVGPGGAGCAPTSAAATSALPSDDKQAVGAGPQPSSSAMADDAPSPPVGVQVATPVADDDAAAAAASGGVVAEASTAPLAPLPAGDSKSSAAPQRKRAPSSAVPLAQQLPRAPRRPRGAYIPLHHGVTGDAGPLDDPSARWRSPSCYSALGNGAGLAGAYICRQAYYTSPSNPGDCPPHVSSKPVSWAKDVMPLFKLVSGPATAGAAGAAAGGLQPSPSYATAFPAAAAFSPSVFASPAASPAHFGAGLAAIPGLSIPPPREDAFSMMSGAASPGRSPAAAGTGFGGPAVAMSSGSSAAAGMSATHSFLRLQRYDSGVDQNPVGGMAADGSERSGMDAVPLLEVPATPRPGEAAMPGPGRLLMRNVLGGCSSAPPLPWASVLAAPNCRDLGPALALGTEREHLFREAEVAALPPVRLWAQRVVSSSGAVEFVRPESAWDRWPTRATQPAAAPAGAPAPALPLPTPASSLHAPAPASSSSSSAAAAASLDDEAAAASSADELEDEAYAALHTAVFDRIKARLQAVHEAVTKELKEKALQKAVHHHHYHGATPAVSGGGARQRLGSVVSSPAPRRASTGGTKARAASQDPLSILVPLTPGVSLGDNAAATPAADLAAPSVPSTARSDNSLASAPAAGAGTGVAEEEGSVGPPPTKRPRLETQTSENAPGLTTATPPATLPGALPVAPPSAPRQSMSDE